MKTDLLAFQRREVLLQFVFTETVAPNSLPPISAARCPSFLKDIEELVMRSVGGRGVTAGRARPSTAGARQGIKLDPRSLADRERPKQIFWWVGAESIKSRGSEWVARKCAQLLRLQIQPKRRS